MDVNVFFAIAVSTHVSKFPELALLYSKTCVKRPPRNSQNNDLNDKWKLNEGRKYCNTFDLH